MSYVAFLKLKLKVIVLKNADTGRLILQSRKCYSGVQNYLLILAFQDTVYFENFCRMSCEVFEILINIFVPKTFKQDLV